MFFCPDTPTCVRVFGRERAGESSGGGACCEGKIFTHAGGSACCYDWTAGICYFIESISETSLYSTINCRLFDQQKLSQQEHNKLY